MTIIVTGGAGFIGSNFVFHMLNKYPDYRIVCLDCLTYAGNLSTLEPVMDNPNFRFVKESITDREAVYKLFEEEKPDMVVNFVGRVDGTLNYEAGTVYNAVRLKAEANILNSTSDGLILCTTEENDSSTTKGNYFGGITGYSDHALIYKASSASGRAGNFSYNKKKENLLLGTYVGGITGYGNYTLLSNCSTEKNGYILGENYVGGIATF